MRLVWRFQFWFGDADWSREAFLHEQTMASSVEQVQPTVWNEFERFLFGVQYNRSPAPNSPNSTNTNTTVDYLGSRSPSLLSDISFFNWFSSQAANRFVIDVLEGQIMTLLVVVAFILIFLIREWVVQQQPVINMVALGDNAAAQRVPAHEVEIVNDDDSDDSDDDFDLDLEEEDAAAEEEDEQAVGDMLLGDLPVDADDDDEETPRPVRRPIPHPSVPVIPVRDRGTTIPFTSRSRRSSSADRRNEAVLKAWQDSQGVSEELRQAMRQGAAEEVARIVQAMPLEESMKLKESLMKLSEDVDESPRQSFSGTARSEAVAQEASSSRDPAFPERSSSLAPQIVDDQEEFTESFAFSPRPQMPARDKSSIATKIRRGLEEHDTWSFADVPQHSGDDTEKPEVDSVPDSWDDKEPEPPILDTSSEQIHFDREPGSDNSSESWQHIPEIKVDNPDQNFSGDKGKGKMVDPGSDDSQHAVPIPAGTDSERLSADPLPIDSDGIATDASVCGSDSYRETPLSDNEEADSEGQQLETAREPSLEPVENQIQVPTRGFRERALDWVYQDVGPGVQEPEDVADEELVVRALADFEQFDQIAARGNERGLNAAVQDPDVAAAAAQAGIDVNDQDAIDDAEDLEGIMELIGMQGPIIGLFQNTMFSAALISLTLSAAIWIPYMVGKVVLVCIGNPLMIFIKIPLQIIATLADLFVDGALYIAAGLVYWMLEGVCMVIKLSTFGLAHSITERSIGLVTGPAYKIATSAANRLTKLFIDTSLRFPLPGYLQYRLSMDSHMALRTIQNTTSHTLNQTSAMVVSLYEDFPIESSSKIAFEAFRQIPASARSATMMIYDWSAALLPWLLTTKSYKVTFNLTMAQNVNSAYATIERWTATDRLIAISAGYGLFAVVGAIYLKHGTPLTSSQQGRKVERIIVEVLQQAGGVLKVILIISIEMLVFPLYCGLLLDMALLPLFKDANLYTRWQFTRDSPWTSGFVHWFIGTCYMFHFALFVSMCRKILRKGVLYFIRDPDDPTFHPVRDVLERSVTTQLRKIAFSGLVYGGLVIICLGGVVWSLNQVTVGVLPIHWVSHAPSLEFPLDLLFYNFLTPVVIKFYNPNDGLHAVSKWWFKLCARGLRMSNFLFGEKKEDEEGHKVDGEMVFDGRYVRAPGSDQVRIPKGDPIFIEVNEHNVRKDGNTGTTGVHNSDVLVTKVYIPPWFRVRIALFVFTIWIFAAAAGISVTIIPLMFGRYLFSLFLPKDVEMNDIHAFSLGIYTLGR
jgi:E3 ubiquitin-protein ligase MARCH6